MALRITGLTSVKQISSIRTWKSMALRGQNYLIQGSTRKRSALVLVDAQAGAEPGCENRPGIGNTRRLPKLRVWET